MNRNKLGGYALLLTGLVACPCHLPFTLAVAAAVLGGTAAGSFLTENWGVVAIGLGVYFVGALLLGFRLVGRATGVGEACAVPPRPPTGGAGVVAAAGVPHHREG